jgi:hypothetical protein
MWILACLMAIGVLLGTAVPLPAFAILSVALLIAYGLLDGDDLRLAGRIYDLILAAIALQVGYFLAVLMRVQIMHRFGAQRRSDSSEENDTEH